LPAVQGARFGHVNLTSRDWHRLAAFYRDVFGCELVPPERDYRGPDLEASSGLAGAHLTGAHFRLPGHGPEGPTLEIYQYDEMAPDIESTPNRPGWGHIAFQVDEVAAALEAVERAGGSRYGQVVTLERSDGRQVTFCYARDPDGNFVELQRWS
jgi:catechol 2,3-dioxygenase-like lactoylglutathione lyase family enzyme